MTARGGEATVAVERIGAAGDGIAEADGMRLYVPFTVPGDRVRVALGPARAGGREARVVARIADGAGRAAPPCPHYGVCGGCALQHLDGEAYLEWKRAIVVEALARRGLHDIEVAPVVVASSPRRRASFALGRAPVEAGFRPRFGKAIVDVRACAVVDARLLALLEPLRAFVAHLPAWRGIGQAVTTLTKTGIDLVLENSARLDGDLLARLAGFADANDLARLSWRSGATVEVVVERHAPTVDIAGVAVVPPPGGFLQATDEAETAIGTRVVAALGGAKYVADLYAGLGTWSFRLAASARVHAVEGDASLVDALRRAAARAGLAGRVEAETRDLARRPLQEDELRPFDAVVFDPPRAGAAPTAAALARSSVARVVAVSCNPATFARDARTLVDGGYVLDTVIPIDQFRYAPHVELVGVFRRRGGAP